MCRNYMAPGHHNEKSITLNFTGWTDFVKEKRYPVYKNSFKIRTESVDGSNDKVAFRIQTNEVNISWITTVRWRFRDWGYTLLRCTPEDFSLKLIAVPSAVKKTWEITATTEKLVIKCNEVEVLDFIYNNAYSDKCSAKVEGREVRTIMFIGEDSATKKFESGK